MDITYVDFEVELGAGPDGYTARLMSSPVGRRPAASFERPFGPDELQALLTTLEQQVDASYRNARDMLTAPEPPAPGHAVLTPAELGERLFGVLIGDGAMRDAFDLSRCRVRSRTGDDGIVALRLRVTLEPEGDVNELAASPWELIHHGREFLGRMVSTPVVRAIGNARSFDTLQVRGRPRVLVVDSNPLDMGSLDSKRERKAVLEALGQDLGVEVDHHPADFASLHTALRDGGYHVLHFIGHGGFLDAGHRAAREGSVLFFEDRHGRAEAVDGMLLAERLKEIPTLRLVVLNCCWGAACPRRAGLEPFTGVAAALAQHLPAVVAMQFPISDQAAVAFATTLYQRLAAFEPVEAAVTDGRQAILSAAHPRPSLEWVTPVLFLNTSDGRLFVKDETMTPPGHLRPDASPEPLRLGIRSFEGWGELEQKSDHRLDLTEYFDGRWIRHPSLWTESVWPQLDDFLLTHAARAGRPVILDFAAHASIACAAGYCLEAKSGLDLRLIQRGITGETTYDRTAGTGPSLPEPLWQEPEEQVLHNTSAAVAFAVGVTHDVTGDVHEYLGANPSGIGRLVRVQVAPEPGQKSVHDGMHALQLAQRLLTRLRQRSAAERRAPLHLFVSAPNAFVFYLGQLARSLGTVQLYEHDFKRERGQPYWPSLRLPVGEGR